MSLTTDSTAASLDLVSTTMASSRLNISTTHATVIGDLIEEVSAEFDSYIDRNLAARRYTETVPSFDGSLYLRLSQAPIVTTGATVVVVHTPIGSTTGSTIASTSYDVLSSLGMIYSATGWDYSGVWRGNISPDRYVRSERENFSVTYTAGYSLPSTASAVGADLPLTIRSAAIKTVGQWFNDLGFEQSASAFRSIRTEDFEVQAWAPDEGGAVGVMKAGYGELDDGVMRILDRFRLDL